MTTLRDTYAYLPPPAECLAILVGFAEITIFGLAGIASPLDFAKGYGLSLKSVAAARQHPGALAPSDEDVKSSKEAGKTDTAMLSAIAARNIQHGALILAFGLYFKDRRALGLTVAAGFITTMADLLLVHKYGLKEAAFGHIIGVANCSLIGTSLLWWGRNDPWW